MSGWVAMMLMASGPVAPVPSSPVPSSLVPSRDVRAPQPTPRTASEFRLMPVRTAEDPRLRINDPRSMLQSGYGGSLIDLFPFEGGKFHLSGGGRLFGRAGRPRPAAIETLRPLQPLRGGVLRGGRRFSPAMLVGYGRTVERGLALGLDAGLVMGKLSATPDRMGRLNRRRLESLDGRGRRTPTNQIARVTALYRF